MGLDKLRFIASIEMTWAGANEEDGEALEEELVFEISSSDKRDRLLIAALVCPSETAFAEDFAADDLPPFDPVFFTETDIVFFFAVFLTIWITLLTSTLQFFISYWGRGDES